MSVWGGNQTFRWLPIVHSLIKASKKYRPAHSLHLSSQLHVWQMSDVLYTLVLTNQPLLCAVQSKVGVKWWLLISLKHETPSCKTICIRVTTRYKHLKRESNIYGRREGYWWENCILVIVFIMLLSFNIGEDHVYTSVSAFMQKETVSFVKTGIGQNDIKWINSAFTFSVAANFIAGWNYQ